MAIDLEHIPQVGFGLWKIDDDACPEIVRQAVQAGYRHFDSACDYGNESGVGKGLKSALENGLCVRDDLWVTSKLWNTYHKAEHVRPALEKTLSDLKLDYLDLYMVHFPIALKYVPFDTRYPPEWIHDPEDDPVMRPAPVPLQETWQAMEALVDAGLTRYIGVCNYNSALIHDLMAYARIKPAMLQVELHPYLTQERLLRLCEGYGVRVTGFSPLGALSYVPLEMAEKSESVLEEDVVVQAANRTGKTPAQVVLRWGVQRGTCIIPKTVRPERMAENIDIFDFELTDEEMTAISALNRNRRFNDPGYFCEKAFGTFYPIYD